MPSRATPRAVSRIKTIIIANVAEAFAEVLDRVRDRAERRMRVTLEHDLAQRAYFWADDDKLVITPFPLQRILQNHNLRVCGYTNVKTVSPNVATVSLCDAIARDPSLIGLLRRTLGANPDAIVSPYAETPQFVRLMKKLRIRSSPSLSSARPFLRSYLDSKIGFRIEMSLLLSQIRSASVPAGVVCRDADDVEAAVALFRGQGKSCVAKANEGESGWGLVMLPKRMQQRQIRRRIHEVFRAPGPWKGSPIVVEEFIPPRRSRSASPSAEVFVSGQSVEVTYLCSQAIGRSGDFQGVVLGPGVLRRTHETLLRKAALIVGKRYQRLGYRGYFDLDSVISARGRVYLLETNARRTGGTHVYDLAQFLYGRDALRRVYFASSDVFRYGGRPLTAAAILARMKSLLFPFGTPPRGFVVTMVSQQVSSFGFVLIAPTARDARALYRSLLRIWRR
jgi:hypothetical protein